MLNKHFIFVEELLYKNGKGHISVIEMDDSGNCSDPIIILKKDYHLSYPFIIEENGEIFMIPETSQNGQIQLYKCKDFPYKWELERILIDNVVAVDTTIHKYEDKYWLFTNIKENKGGPFDDELFIFWSDRLNTNNWTSHPGNPVVSDVRKSRCAGKLFVYNENLYRPSQDCSKHYGYGINISHINNLNENGYTENVVESIYPLWDKDLISTHTINSDRDITVIDALIKRKRF